MRNEDFHHHLVILESLDRQVQGTDGSLQGCLQVNTNKVTEKGFNVHLNEGPNVALNKLFFESSVITPHSTAVIKNRTTRIFQEAQEVIVIDPLGEGNSSYPITVPPWHFQDPVGALGDHVRARFTAVSCHEWSCSSTSKSHQASMICSSVSWGSLSGPAWVIDRVHSCSSREGLRITRKTWISVSSDGRSRPYPSNADCHNSSKEGRDAITKRGSQRQEPNCSNQGRLEPMRYQLTCCWHRWSTCKASQRQQGKVQYWHFCWKGQITDPKGGLVGAALLTGGSSPGGAGIPEDAVDSVTVDSCFCVDTILMVS